MKIVNPATNETIKEIKSDTEQSIREKFLISKLAQRMWKKRPLNERLMIIEKFTGLLKENLEELALVLTSETGKPLKESKGEILAAITKTKYFLDKSPELLKADEVHNDDFTNEVLSYDPLGVIVNISAWNYPYLVGVNIFIPALICGNSVLYKPSEYSSLTGIKIEELLIKSGVPKDIFTAFYGDGEVGRMLLKLPIDGVFFTGSYPTGVKINQSVADKLIPVGLELGGKDPLYITDEIDSIDSAAANAVSGAFYNNGQSCCSVERIYIHEKIYDQFCKDFIKHTNSLVVGDPLNEKTDQGAITRRSHLEFLKSQVEDAINKGAKLQTGGQIIEGPGNYFSPTVLTDVNHNMDLMMQESFGPLIGLMKVKDDNEAISLMNDTNFGLTSSVFTHNFTRGENILKEIDSGTGYLNCCDRVSPHLPWSGRNQSGLGSTLSKHGVYAFCNPKGTHLRR